MHERGQAVTGGVTAGGQVVVLGDQARVDAFQEGAGLGPVGGVLPDVEGGPGVQGRLPIVCVRVVVQHGRPGRAGEAG